VPFALNEEARAWAVKVGRRLPEPASRRLRPLYSRLAGPPGEPSSTIVIPPARPVEPVPEFVTLPPPAENPFQAWPRPAPAGYLGQLDPDAQKAMAEEWADVGLEDCLFYHRVRLTDGRVIEGTWNLIGGEEEYLGGIDLEGRRVLEFGPASGWLTTWMEGQDASVVGFDLGWELTQDFLPLPGLDVDRLTRDFIRRTCRSQNSWWYLHRDYGLSARAVYGSIYDLPADIGRYDVSVFGSILLHLRDPFRAMEQAALHTEEAVVVVEPLILDLVDQGSVVRWDPTGGENPTGWWHHSPAAIIGMLKVLGFPKASVTYHRQPYDDEDQATHQEDVAFFTVVARRS
jgi:O-methyltransferase